MEVDGSVARGAEKAKPSHSGLDPTRRDAPRPEYRGGPLVLPPSSVVRPDQQAAAGMRGRHRQLKAKQSARTVLAAQDRSSYNDRVLSAAGDAALARRVHDEELAAAADRAQQQQQRPAKRAKLTGKALIKKKLGL